MTFTGNDIPPDISEEERKINIENLFNVIFSVKKLQGFSHCVYESESSKLHIYINK